MKKILLVTLSWHTDHQEVLFSMYSELKKRGIKAYTLTIHGGDYVAPQTDENFFIKAPLNPGFDKQTLNCFEIIKLIKTIRNIDFDMVYFESFHDWNYLIMLYCMCHKKNIIHMMHDVIDHEGDSHLFVKKLFKKMFVFMSDIVLTKSQQGVDTFKKQYPQSVKKVRKVNVWREFSGYSQPVGNTVLFFGRLNLYKGLDELYQIIKNTPDIQFIVKGKPDSTDVSIVEKIRLLPNATLDDQTIPYAALDDLFKHSKCVILPYKSATQSGVVIDAFKHSCPVIAFNVGALGEQVLDNRTGYLVPPGNIEAFKESIYKIFSLNETDYSQMCRNAYDFGLAQFSAQSQVDDFIKELEIL